MDKNRASAPELCKKCGDPITANFVKALDSLWHSDCFVCVVCAKHFEFGKFNDHEGKLYCDYHYCKHHHTNVLCANNEQVI